MTGGGVGLPTHTHKTSDKIRASALRCWGWPFNYNNDKIKCVIQRWKYNISQKKYCKIYEYHIRQLKF